MQRRPIHVLLVDTERAFAEGLRVGLSSVRAGLGIELHWAPDWNHASARLVKGGIDVVILELDLPESSGLVTFERAHAFASDVPIIVLTASRDEELAVEALHAGAQDCLVRGELSPSLLARSVRHAIERHRLLSHLRELAVIDDLTKLFNRRGFAELGEKNLAGARRRARGVALVFLDLDHFKAINDQYGHHVGDRALKKVADILRQTFRTSDLIARLGGDEFAVLAEESGESAEALIDRLRERLREFNEQGPEPYRLDASIGMVRHDGDLRVRLEDLLAEADRQMYGEKRGKRKVLLG